MFLDILSQDSTIVINKKIAQTLGLKTAVYTAEIVELYKKAFNEGAIDNEHYILKPDTEFIKADTTLMPDEQALALANLVNVGIIDVDGDKLRLRPDILVAFITNSNVSGLTDLLEGIAADKEAVKANKQEYMKEALKKGIKESDPKFAEMIKAWVDSAYSVRPVSKAALQLFIKKIKDYTNDPYARVRIAEIAVAKNYVDATWAIDLYSKEQTKNAFANRLPAKPMTATKIGSEQRVATSTSEVGKGF